MARARCALGSEVLGPAGRDVAYLRVHHSGSTAAAAPAAGGGVVAAARGETAATHASHSPAAPSGKSGAGALGAEPPGILRLSGPLLHAHLVDGIADDSVFTVPCWHRLAVRRAEVHSLATGTVAGNGSLTLTAAARRGAPQEAAAVTHTLPLREYWVRRMTRVGAPLYVALPLALLQTGAITAAHYGFMVGVMSLRAEDSRIGLRAEFAIQGVAVVMPLVAMAANFWFASRARAQAGQGEACFPRCPAGRCRCALVAALCPTRDSGCASRYFWISTLLYASVYGLALVLVTNYDRQARWASAQAYKPMFTWSAIHAATLVPLLLSVRTHGAALALIPRPRMQAAVDAKQAADARSFGACNLLRAALGCGISSGYVLQDDGTAQLPEGATMAIPPGTHVLVARSAEEAGAWERALAYESCNGVLGVSLGVLERLLAAGRLLDAGRRRAAQPPLQKQDNPAAVLPRDTDAPPLPTSFFNYEVLKPACEAAAAARARLALAADAALRGERLAAARQRLRRLVAAEKPEAEVEAAREELAQCAAAAARAGLMETARTDAGGEKALWLPFQRSYYDTFLAEPPPAQRGPRATAAAAGSAAAEATAGARRLPGCDFPPVSTDAGRYDDDVGPAAAFISHFWGNPFDQLVGALKAEVAMAAQAGARFHLLSACLDAEFRRSGSMEEPPLLVERAPKFYWLDLIFKNQANASVQMTKERAGELEATFDKHYRRSEATAKQDYVAAGHLRRDEEEQLLRYSAGTRADFDACISGPGVVESICPELETYPAGQPPEAWGRLWCLFELFKTAAAEQPGPLVLVAGGSAAATATLVPATSAAGARPSLTPAAMSMQRPWPGAAQRLLQTTGADWEHMNPSCRCCLEGRVLKPLQLKIDLRAAKATSPLDLFFIFDEVRTAPGGFAAVEAKVSAALVSAQHRFATSVLAWAKQRRAGAFVSMILAATMIAVALTWFLVGASRLLSGGNSTMLQAAALPLVPLLLGLSLLWRSCADASEARRSRHAAKAARRRVDARAKIREGTPVPPSPPQVPAAAAVVVNPLHSKAAPGHAAEAKPDLGASLAPRTP